MKGRLEAEIRKTKIARTKPKLSPKEVDSIVKGFFHSWIRGEVDILFPLADQFQLNTPHMDGFEISVGQALKLEIQNKDEFIKLIDIYAGRYESTPSELRKATYSLLHSIVQWRAADRIVDGTKGRFLQYGIEDKIRELERKIDTTDQLLRQFIELLRQEKESKK